MRHVYFYAVCLLALLPLAGCNKSSITVNITPADAVAAGARWNLDGGEWQVSGATVQAPAGAHTVDFERVPGWIKPASEAVNLGNNENKTLGGAYVPDDWEPDTGIFDVVLAPETVRVPEEDLPALLMDEDPENHVYTFDAAAADAAGLDLSVGNPLLLECAALRRITGVERTGDGRLIVSTGFIPLNEVVQSGTIAWDFGVEFTAEKVSQFYVPGYGNAEVKAGTPIELNFDIGKYKYGIKATLDGDHSDIEFTVTKPMGGSAGAKMTAKGTIERFRSRESMVFAGAKLTNYNSELDALRGDVTLEMVVAATGNDFVNLELPATIMTIPFTVGFVPVQLNIKVKFVVNAAVPLDGSSRVRTKFTYNSAVGFNFDGVSVSAGGRAGDVRFGDDELHETGASSGISANFGVGFPRVELGIFGETLVPYAQTGFLIGGDYTFNPACQRANALFQGAVGYDLSFLGFNLLSGSKTLFEHKKPLLRAGDCPADKEDLSEYGLMEESLLLLGE